MTLTSPCFTYESSTLKCKRKPCDFLTKFSPLLGKSDPFVTVKEGSEGKEKFRTRTIVNTLDPLWNETAVVAMPDTNGLLLLVRTYEQIFSRLQELRSELLKILA